MFTQSVFQLHFVRLLLSLSWLLWYVEGKVVRVTKMPWLWEVLIQTAGFNVYPVQLLSLHSQVMGEKKVGTKMLWDWGFLMMIPSLYIEDLYSIITSPLGSLIVGWMAF